MPGGRDAHGLELAPDWRRHTRLLDYRAERETRGGVAILVGRAQAEHPARPGLEDGDRRQRAVGVEELGHAHLPGQQAFHRGSPKNRRSFGVVTA